MKVYGVIYGLHDPETGELRYIGQTRTGLKERLWSHLGPSNRRKNYHSARWVNSLVMKGLKPEARLRATASSREDLDQLEIKHIAGALAEGVRLTNHAKGGRGPEGCRHTPEWCQYMAQLMAGRCTNTPEHMANLAEMKRGIPRTPEVKAKISEARKGQPSPNKGVPMPEAVKSKVSASRKGKLTGATHHQYRHYISTDDILHRLADSQSKVEIAAALGVSPTFIHRRLGQARRAGKEAPRIEHRGHPMGSPLSESHKAAMSVSKKGRRRGPTHHAWHDIPVEAVLAKMGQGTELRAIAAEFGVTPKTIRHKLREAGVGCTPKPEVPMDLVLQRLSEGATLRVISEELGFPYMTVWRRVRQHRGTI